jgi:hypothetical protein
MTLLILSMMIYRSFSEESFGRRVRCVSSGADGGLQDKTQEEKTRPFGRLIKHLNVIVVIPIVVPIVVITVAAVIANRLLLTALRWKVITVLLRFNVDRSPLAVTLSPAILLDFRRFVLAKTMDSGTLC